MSLTPPSSPPQDPPKPPEEKLRANADIPKLRGASAGQNTGTLDLFLSLVLRYGAVQANLILAELTAPGYATRAIDLFGPGILNFNSTGVSSGIFSATTAIEQMHQEVLSLEQETPAEAGPHSTSLLQLVPSPEAVNPNVTPSPKVEAPRAPDETKVAELLKMFEKNPGLASAVQKELEEQSSPSPSSSSTSRTSRIRRDRESSPSQRASSARVKRDRDWEGIGEQERSDKTGFER